MAPAYSKKKPVDHTGAGDAFASAFVAVLMKSDDYHKEEIIDKAISFASFNAHSVIQYLGAKKGILSNFIFPKNFKIRKIKL